VGTKLTKEEYGRVESLAAKRWLPLGGCAKTCGRSPGCRRPLAVPEAEAKQDNEER
jgi:hypothetical protein